MDLIIFDRQLFMKKAEYRNGMMKIITGYYKACKFGLVPVGDTPTSKRFYDMIRCSTIPIVLSDQLTLPFEYLFFYPELYMVQIYENKMRDIGRTMCLINSDVESLMRKSIKDIRIIHSIRGNLIDLGEENLFSWHLFLIVGMKKQCERRGLIKTIL